MSKDALLSDVQKRKIKKRRQVDVSMVYVFPAQFGVTHKHRTQSAQITTITNELPVGVTLGMMEMVTAHASTNEI